MRKSCAGLRRTIVAGLLVLAAVGCRGEANGTDVVGDGTPPQALAAAPPRTEGQPSPAVGPGAAGLGRGFIVWESNRTGRWRIWTRRLDGSDLRQLSPNEPGRSHCCAHIAPDGSRVTYLSFEGTGNDYPDRGPIGRLHVIRPDGSGDRVVADAVRTYFENRAAVWRGAAELIYIDGAGYTVERNLRTDAVRRLTAAARDRHGWLIDPTLRFAVDGSAAFSPYDAARRGVAARAPLGGCEPYFTADGRWGFWVAGAGGPINRIDLGSRAIGTILQKNDPRLESDYGYLYFPMISPDRRLLTWAASKGEHDHFKVDYEVFVAPIDPRTLELSGQPVRMTRNRATDRYPDAFLEPLPLGRHQGEAPFRVRLEAPQPGAWAWEFGDGDRARGGIAEHTWERPGSYRVTAREDGQTLVAQIVVEPARAPRALTAELRDGGRELVVRFSEPVRAISPDLRLASGTPVAGLRLEDEGRTLVARLGKALGRGDRLTISGFQDRAQRPNPMSRSTLAIEPPSWPARRADLAFLWRTGDAPNLVPVAGATVERACTLEAHGVARLDHAWRVVLGAGSFEATPDASAAIRRACQSTNSMSIEFVVDPGSMKTAPLLRTAGGYPNFTLTLRDGRLELALRTGSPRRRPYERASLMALPQGQASHVVLTYSPGQLTGYVDGEQAVRSDAIQGDFFHWRNQVLVVGGEAAGGIGAGGVLEGVAIYGRVLSAEEVKENAARYRDLMARRPAVPRTVVEATLTARSTLPTLQEITPYRRGLVVYRYTVDRVLRGEAPRDIRVAHWAILDGRTQAVAERRPGSKARLALEPFEANPQLASLYLSDTLQAAASAPLFYSVTD